jgi:hypothetical protein
MTMQYSENEVFESLRRMVRIYLESYPEDREGLERFMRWTHTQFGYVYTDIPE